MTAFIVDPLLVVAVGNNKVLIYGERERTKMSKNVLDAIRERRSIRRFQALPVPDGIVEQLIEAAVMAPSAGNLQPWRFFVVKDEKVRQALAMAAGGQNFVAAAPVAIVVCADPTHSASRYGKRGAKLYCLQDTAAAVQNILLAAAAFGLGSCWVGAFDEELVAEALDLEERFRPVAILPIGYPAESPRLRPRRPFDEVASIIEGPPRT